MQETVRQSNVGKGKGMKFKWDARLGRQKGLVL